MGGTNTTADASRDEPVDRRMPVKVESPKEWQHWWRIRKEDERYEGIEAR